jgi:RimJ/RimL family protein N-acetyltransferase
VTGRDVRFRPMTAADLRLLHDWIRRPHALPWYGQDHHGSYEDVVAHYLPAIEGRDPTDHYIVVVDGAPVGMVQTYVVADYPDYADLVGVADRATAGVDIIIGEEEATGKGLGTEVLRRFVDEIVFGRLETTSCVADPDANNIASLRAFQKAGFRTVREFVEDPGDGRVHLLVRRDRD